jgi:Uma2 family endonuclease
MTVEIDDDTDYEPDALVNCGPPVPADAVAAPSPVIVVEVLSPSTRVRDAGAKLEDYFRVATIAHYLLVKTERRAVIHHRRRDDGWIDTRIVSLGLLRLDPPGLDLDVDVLCAGAADPG